MFMPKVNLERRAAWYKDGEPDAMSPVDAQVIIQDGQILAGTLCKKTLGAAAGGLVHITWMEYGPEAARAVLSQVGVGWLRWETDRCQKPAGNTDKAPTPAPPPALPRLQIQFTINQWLLQHGFSIGIGDLIADPRTMEIINDIMEKAKHDVKKLIEKVQVGGRWVGGSLVWANVVMGGRLDGGGRVGGLEEIRERPRWLPLGARCVFEGLPLPFPRTSPSPSNDVADQRPGAAARAHHHGVI